MGSEHLSDSFFGKTSPLSGKLTGVISVTADSFPNRQLTSNEGSEIFGRIRKVPFFRSPFTKYSWQLARNVDVPFILS